MIFLCCVTPWMLHTVEPGYGDALKEDQEQQRHSAGRVVVKQFEHIEPSLVAEKKNITK